MSKKTPVLKQKEEIQHQIVPLSQPEIRPMLLSIDRISNIYHWIHSNVQQCDYSLEAFRNKIAYIIFQIKQQTLFMSKNEEH